MVNAWMNDKWEAIKDAPISDLLLPGKCEMEVTNAALTKVALCTVSWCYITGYKLAMA